MATFHLVKRPLAVLALGVTGTLFVAATTASIGASDQASRNQQRVAISVVDKKGVPVPSLSLTDLTVKEDGISREVLKVEPATDPMAIAVLIDTSSVTSPAVTDLRAAVKAFSQAIWAKSPDTQIALYSFGERPTLEADFSSGAANLDRRIDRLFAASGAGAYFIDAVIDAAAALKKRAAGRSVIVSYVDENGPEFSNRRNEQVFDAVAAARASLWTVSRQGFGGGMSSPESRERAIVIGDVTTRTGGRGATVFDGTALKGRFTELANQLLAQFVVTYGRPETLVPPDKLEIRLTNSDLRVAAPRWTTR